MSEVPLYGDCRGTEGGPYLETAGFIEHTPFPVSSSGRMQGEVQGEKQRAFVG